MGHFEDGLFKYILFMNAFVISWSYLTTSWLMSKKRLESQGYPEEYITANQNIKQKATMRWIGLYIVLQTTVLATLYFTGVTITSKVYVSYVFPFTFIPAMIYVITFKKKCNTVLKDAAHKAQSDIVIDFNFRALNLILNPRIEVLSLMLMVYFNMRYLDNVSILYFFGILPWFNYVALKNTRFQTRETLKDQYKLIGLATIFLQALKSYEYIKYIVKEWAVFDGFDVVLFFCLVLVLAITLIMGVVNFPKVRKVFEAQAEESEATPETGV